MLAIKENIITILVVLTILMYLSFTAYLKYKLKFWITQPVFHMYNLFYWIYPVGIIYPDMPTIQTITQKGASKYLNVYHIKTHNVEDIKETVLCTHICNFIKTNYIFQDKDSRHSAEYLPSQKDIMEYYYSTNHPSFFSVYETPKILFEKGEAVTTIEELNGIICARSLNITLKKMPSFPTYYIDNLCIDPLQRKSGLAPQMIQTHCYNLRQNNKKIQTCLFKREGQLNALVPLVAFETYCFRLTNAMAKATFNTVIEIGVQQLSLFHDFLQTQKQRFECTVFPDLSNLLNLIKKENLLLYGIINRQGQLLASYIFRPLNLTYSGEKAIECINILIANKNDDDINAVLTSVKKKSPFELLLIEDTADAKCSIDYLISNKASIQFKSPTAFFLYNYATRPLAKSGLALMIY